MPRHTCRATRRCAFYLPARRLRLSSPPLRLRYYRQPGTGVKSFAAFTPFHAGGLFAGRRKTMCFLMPAVTRYVDYMKCATISR